MQRYRRISPIMVGGKVSWIHVYYRTVQFSISGRRQPGCELNVTYIIMWTRYSFESEMIWSHKTWIWAIDIIDT